MPIEYSDGWTGDLPPSVLETANFAPVEDVVLPILRAALPDVRIYSLIPEDTTLIPYLVVRVAPTERFWTGDDRFVDWATIFVHAFADDPDGDRKAALLSEAARVALRDAWLNQVVTEHGSICAFRTMTRPTRRADWTTATGPVQYADLLTDTHRYEGLYAIQIRRPVPKHTS